MGKIVVNKHKNSKVDITPNEFVNKGEIIISNEVGSEGIFILNNDGNTIFISAHGNNTDGPSSEETHVLLSVSQYNELIENNKVVVNGKEIIYRSDAYYAIYEDDNE